MARSIRIIAIALQLLPVERLEGLGSGRQINVIECPQAHVFRYSAHGRDFQFVILSKFFDQVLHKFFWGGSAGSDADSFLSANPLRVDLGRILNAMPHSDFQIGNWVCRYRCLPHTIDWNLNCSELPLQASILPVQPMRARQLADFGLHSRYL